MRDVFEAPPLIGGLMTREERIRHYAYDWFEVYKERGYPPDPTRDWLKAEHLVDGEDEARIRQDMVDHKYKCLI